MANEKLKEPVEKVQDAAKQAARAESAPVPTRRYRTLLFQGVLVIVAIAFGILTFLVKSTPFFKIDLRITRDVQLIQSPIFGTIMDFLSWPGFGPQSFLITALAILVIYTFGLRWEAISALFAAVFSTLLNVLVKDLVQRPRPASALVHVFAALKSYSFPSGHVMFYLVFFGFIWFLAFTLLRHSVWRTFLLVVLGFFIAFIGVSRVYQGEHWASDVIGSYLLGTLTLWVVIRFYLWGKKRYFVKQTVVPEPAET